MASKTRQHNVSAAQWAANGDASGQTDFMEPGAAHFGENVFGPAVAEGPPAEGRLQEAAGHARGRRGARPGARRRRRQGDARVGDGEGRDPLHALVPAADEPDGGEARLVLQPVLRRRRPGARGVLRQGADPGRAGRLVVPDRRPARDVRGTRLHRVGSDVAGVRPREPERRLPLHPDRVRVLDRRGARPEDPAAALDGRAVEGRRSRAEAVRRQDVDRASSRRSAPSRSTS